MDAADAGPSVPPAPAPHAPTSPAAPQTTLTIHLPSHPTHLLTPSLTLPSSSPISLLKLQISRSIQGRPSVGGLRLFAQGRALRDGECVGEVWGTEGHVHVAVHPAAWGGAPPSEGGKEPAVQAQAQAYPAPLAPATPMALSTPTPFTGLPVLPPAAPSPATDPHTSARIYYLYLYTTSIALLTNAPLPRAPYASREQEREAREGARAYVERMGIRSGLQGDEGCELPGVGVHGAGEWKTVLIDGLPYLMQVSALPAQTPQQQLALRTLLSSQPLLHLLSSPLSFPNAFPTNSIPGAAAAAARGEANTLRLRFTVHLPPLSLLVALSFALFRILFFCFLFTRGGSLERKALVVLVAGIWGVWEVNRLVGQHFAAAGVAGAAQAAANAAAALGRGAPPAAQARPPHGQQRSPVLELFAESSLPVEDALLFPASYVDPTNPPRRPTALDHILAHPWFSLPAHFLLTILPEFSRLRSKALAQRERRVREFYGPMRRLAQRRREGEQGEMSDEERRAVEWYARLGTRERRYVERVLDGELDEIAVMWAAAEGGAEEVGGAVW
ncbi:hypothetical protein CALCODRAFT_479240 [Calocera cornea HHB12733]|uniref:Ubiquitin-like domain-containing protein n=1 Tax=Calocera cornea HHB12733 TaxID=1353952 RepID=A0A165JW28_9BASI|nr:hypothetical protein CALCODRAFT_479240 [Calocera cornea HHB12733]